MTHILCNSQCMCRPQKQALSCLPPEPHRDSVAALTPRAQAPFSQFPSARGSSLPTWFSTSPRLTLFPSVITENTSDLKYLNFSLKLEKCNDEKGRENIRKKDDPLTWTRQPHFKNILFLCIYFFTCSKNHYKPPRWARDPVPSPKSAPLTQHPARTGRPSDSQVMVATVSSKTSVNVHGVYQNVTDGIVE